MIKSYQLEVEYQVQMYKTQAQTCARIWRSPIQLKRSLSSVATGNDVCISMGVAITRSSAADSRVKQIPCGRLIIKSKTLDIPSINQLID